ncbi:MAG TPA: polysaccharide deacetylase family protein [Terriglobales bacterium]|nr:polysaccharide deacetylase family protein [Terriglobales bacterium]
MRRSRRSKVANLSLAIVLLVSSLLLGGQSKAVPGELQDYRIPILVYHRFGKTVADSTTMTVERFEAQLKYLRDNGYNFIPLRELVLNRLTGEPALPKRAVIITADDGHRSVYVYMLGLARKYQLPVTLFIYPSAISNADYALTWEQLRALKDTGLFDLQSHSYWHPNFNQEKRRMNSRDYGRFVRMQLVQSKQVLESKLGGTVDLLAWPFGIFNDELIGKAKEAGYVAGFTTEGRHVTPRDPLMTLPRYMITQAIDMRGFTDLIAGKRSSSTRGYKP